MLKTAVFRKCSKRLLHTNSRLLIEYNKPTFNNDGEDREVPKALKKTKDFSFKYDLSPQSEHSKESQRARLEESMMEPDIHDQKAENARIERSQRIQALVTGALLLLGVMGTYEIYQKYPIIKAKFFGDEAFFEENLPVLKKNKKYVDQLPLVTNPNDSNYPGLYIWGDNSQKLIPEEESLRYVKIPIRFSFFDGFLLKDLKLSSSSGAVIDDNGDLYQWNANDSIPLKTLAGESLVKSEISNGLVYLLNSRGEVLMVPELPHQENPLFTKYKSTNWLGMTSVKKYNKLDFQKHLTRGERVKDIAGGKEHLVILTTKGRVFSCATGLAPIERSVGQFGIPSLSQFDPVPLPNKIYEVSLLNNMKVKKDRSIYVAPREITQIASGDYHSLALDQGGSIWAWGQNTYGQLGQIVTYKTEIQPIPKKITSFSKQFGKFHYPIAKTIHAGGVSSYATFVAKDIQDAFYDVNDLEKKEYSKAVDDEFFFSWGNGVQGQLGVGHYTHSQCDPIKIKELMKMKEYSELYDGIVTVPIKNWSAGSKHVAVTLNNAQFSPDSKVDNDVMVWGSNEFGQLGNGKRTKAGFPVKIPSIIEPNSIQEQESLKGDKLPKSLKNVNNNRLQLFDSKKLSFKNQNGKKMNCKVEQVIYAGEDNTAIFYRRVK